jgi:hypothetical protein
LKKRTKKLLSLGRERQANGSFGRGTKQIKVFCFFFSKKKSFFAAMENV